MRRTIVRFAVVALAISAVFGRALDAQDGTLRLRLTAAPGAMIPVVTATFENTGASDYVLNLGMMLGNGKTMFPSAIELTFIDDARQGHELVVEPLLVAGRIDDYLVSLPAGATYTLPLPLADYHERQSGKLVEFKGRCELRARFVGTAAQFAKNGTADVALLNFWSGTVRSGTVMFTASLSAADVLDVIDAVRRVIDGPQPRVRVIVAGANLDTESRRLLKRDRNALEAFEVPGSADSSLPESYLVIQSVQITGDRGTAVALLGPVPRPKPGIPLLACGSTYRIALEKTATGWQARIAGLTVC